MRTRSFVGVRRKPRERRWRWMTVGTCPQGHTDAVRWGAGRRTICWQCGGPMRWRAGKYRRDKRRRLVRDPRASSWMEWPYR